MKATKARLERLEASQPRQPDGLYIIVFGKVPRDRIIGVQFEGVTVEREPNENINDLAIRAQALIPHRYAFAVCSEE